MRGTGIVRLTVLAVAFGALAACGSEKQQDAAPEPAPTPTGYYIMAKDIYQAHPRDICRQKNAEFVPNLVGRIDAALRLAELGSVADFDHFDAQPNETGKGGMQAIIWVNAVYKGKPATSIVAVGDFDPATCNVGPMKAGAGQNALMDPKLRKIPVL